MTIGTTTTGEPLTAALTPTAHSTVDHTGLPGVGDLSTAAHAVLSHAGLPGVGNLATAPGAGLVDHTTLDHSAIPGIGLSGFVVLDSTATAASIQAALNAAANRVVYLKPGTYNLGNNVQINIPDGKALIGLGVPNTYDMNYGQAPRFNVGSQSVGGGGYFYVGGTDTAIIKNIVIVGGSGSNSGYAITTGRRCIVENVFIEDWMQSGTTTGAGIFVATGSILRNVLVRNSKNHGFLIANGNNRAPCVLEHCTAYQCDADGFRISNDAHLLDCYAFGNAGAGFRGQSGCTNQRLHNCNAESNTTDGFNWTSSSGGDGTQISNSHAVTNTGYGFNVTAATGGRPALIGNMGRGNTTANFNIIGWQNLSNWNAV